MIPRFMLAMFGTFKAGLARMLASIR